MYELEKNKAEVHLPETSKQRQKSAERSTKMIIHHTFLLLSLLFFC